MGSKINTFQILVNKMYEKKSVWEAKVGELCRRIRFVKSEAGCDKMPTDLLRLALHLNVKTREVPLAMRGRLLRENGNFVVEVNADLSSFDKRQTLAHELSHLIIEHKYLSLIPNREDRSRVLAMEGLFKIEKLCDEVANEILLPLLWLSSRIGTSKPSLNLLQAIVSESATSLDYVIARVLSKRLWYCRFIWWQKEIAVAIKSYPSSNIEILLENPKTSLITRSLVEQKFMDGQEKLIIEGKKDIYQIQCIPLDKTNVLAMLSYA